MSDLQLGPFTAGEIPPPVVVQFTDSDENPIDITGYAVRFQYRERNATAPTTLTGALEAPTQGKARYTWAEADLATAGDYQAIMWVGNGTNRYASKHIDYRVRDGLGSTPAI